MNRIDIQANRKPVLQKSRPRVLVMMLLIAMFGSGAARANERDAKQAAPSARYVVKSGDSLYTIASRYLLEPRNWIAVMRFNHLSSRSLRPGVRLQLPIALLKREDLAAHVIATSGPAERAFGDGPFIPLLIDSVLTEGDLIRTGHNGFVTLETPDGS